MLRTLPEKPNLTQLKKQAKDLQRNHRRREPQACKTLRWLDRFMGASDDEILQAGVGLQEVQQALAMEYGFESWNALRGSIQSDAQQLRAQAQYVSPAHLRQWQKAIDCLAEAINVPVALIMRVTQEDIEVFVTSNTDGNPYGAGDRERLVGSGLYCEEVIKRRGLLKVPNGLSDEQWKSNPDLKLNMVAYLGLPLAAHGGSIFGTICVLDRQENEFTSAQVKLLSSFQMLIESQLALVRTNSFLENRTEQLNTALLELRSLRGLVRICCVCKSIHTETGWRALDGVLAERGRIRFTHGYCPDCAKEAGKELEEYIKAKEEKA